MLIYVTDLNGFTEPLNTIKGFEMDEEVKGAFTVSFTSFFNENNPGYSLLEEEAIITVDGYDFRIKQLKEVLNRKSVVAISTFYDLVGHRQEEIYGGTRTFNQFADFVFGGTGWTFENIDVTGHVLIPNFGEDNVIKLTQGLCAAFECEFKIMPNKRVHFSKEIGPDNDAQYRYGHNVKALSKSVDTTNLRTVIKGYGGNGLVVTYTSPYASKFPDAGEAEPVRDDRFTIPESLIERIKPDLVDYPETSIELDSVELTDKELGERVWLIYEPLGIEFQTRILSKKTVIRGNKLVTASVVIGNTVPRNLSDILTSQRVEIDENKKQVQSRFEQVNDRITAEVEEVGESVAGLEIRVGEVQIYAEELDESIASVSVKADNISLSVSQLGNRVDSAETNINIQAGQIDARVEKNGVIGAINLSPEIARIQAINIELVGAVTVLSEITGDLGTITAGNIDLHREIKIGDGVHLRGGGRRGVYFEGSGFDYGQVYVDSGNMMITAGNQVRISGTQLDLINTPVINAPNLVTAPNNDRLSLRYSSGSNRLYLDVGGMNVGYVILTN